MKKKIYIPEVQELWKGQVPGLLFLQLWHTLQHDPQMGQGTPGRPLLITPQTLPFGLLQPSCFANWLIPFSLYKSVCSPASTLKQQRERELTVPHRISSCLAGSASHLSGWFIRLSLFKQMGLLFRYFNNMYLRYPIENLIWQRFDEVLMCWETRLTRQITSSQTR